MIASEALRGLHLLLMQPDVRSQPRLSGMLRDAGVVIHLADDLAEASETLDELGRVDFLLIDALTPDNGACDTIARMRDRLASETVIIGLVPADGGDAREQCLARGADDIVEYPCSAGELFDVMIRNLPNHAD